MHSIKAFFAKYSAWVWGVLAPLGAWGVFAIAFVDAALIGMPLDPVVAGYVYHKPYLFWLYTLMASVGSAAGSMVIYVIGYKGGEVLLEKRMSKARFQKIKKSFEDHEFLALMVPAMLPPPTPYKIIVLSAAAFEMDWHKFLLAIFLGRVARFTILSILVMLFGPNIVSITTKLLTHYFLETAAVLAIVAFVCFIVWKMKKRKTNEMESATEA